MNGKIEDFKRLMDDAEKRVLAVPVEPLRPKHVKGNAWMLADQNWKPTPLTQQQAGFFAGARELVDKLVVAGRAATDSMTDTYRDSMRMAALVEIVTEELISAGACTIEGQYGGYYQNAEKLTQDLRALASRPANTTAEIDQSYQQGYEAGIRSEQDRLALLDSGTCAPPEPMQAQGDTEQASEEVVS